MLPSDPRAESARDKETGNEEVYHFDGASEKAIAGSTTELQDSVDTCCTSCAAPRSAPDEID